MTLSWDLALGAPSYGMRQSTSAMVLHTDEGNFEQNVIGAKRLATWQASAGNVSGGSYNFIVSREGIVLSVPYLEASGGISGNHTPPPAGHWRPLPILTANLPAHVIADPNAHVLNVCMLGKTAFYEANGWPDEMVDLLARLVIWVEDQPWAPDDLFLCRHADWQSDRTDPGTRLLPILLKRYAALRNPPEEPSVPTPPVGGPTEEGQLAEQVITLRAQTGAVFSLSQDTDGQPQTRLARLRAEVQFQTATALAKSLRDAATTELGTLELRARQARERIEAI